MKKFFKDFKTFIARGNILDMAVGVIIGNAFSKIVTSLVNNIIMPLLAGAIGNSSVADLKWVLHPAVTDETGNVIKAEAREARANAPKPETTDSILKDIRDLLKTQSEQETK